MHNDMSYLRGIVDAAIARAKAEPPAPTHTRAWSAAEYIRINDWPLCYTIDRGEIVVAMPGRRLVTLDELRALGCAIEYPRRVRRPVVTDEL